MNIYLKSKAAIEKGYNFVIQIYNGKGKLESEIDQDSLETLIK
jgi:hypothetical protein